MTSFGDPEESLPVRIHKVDKFCPRETNVLTPYKAAASVSPLVCYLPYFYLGSQVFAVLQILFDLKWIHSENFYTIIKRNKLSTWFTNGNKTLKTLRSKMVEGERAKRCQRKDGMTAQIG